MRRRYCRDTKTEGSFVSPTPPPVAAANWIVLKFGGTSVSTRTRWDKIAAIAAGWRAQGRRVLIVVSALSGITDQLKAITTAADAAQRQALRDEIVARHQAIRQRKGERPGAVGRLAIV